MTSEYAITMNKDARGSLPQDQPHLTVKVLKPSLTAYSSRTCVINNRPTVVECGIAYGGDIGSFKFATDLQTRFPCFTMRVLMWQER